MENKNLDDGNQRRAAIRELVGEELYAKRRDVLDNAEAVREAARFIRSMREHANLTQDALARRLGVKQARISEIERGASPEGVSYALLKRVATACGFENWPSSPVEVHRTQREEPVVVEVVPSSPIRQEVADAYMRVLGATQEIRAKITKETFRDQPLASGGRIRGISASEKMPKPEFETRALGTYVGELTKFGEVLSRNVGEPIGPSRCVLVTVVAETEGPYAVDATENAVRLIRDALDQSPQVRVVDKQP